jgi:hypothetical protein
MATILRIDTNTNDFCSIQGAHLLGVYGYVAGGELELKLHNGATTAAATLFEAKSSGDPQAGMQFSTMFPFPVRFSGNLSATVPANSLLFVLIK